MAFSADEAFRRALGLLQAGNVVEAERSFKKLLRAQPRHVGALNLLSILMTQLGRLAEAEDYVRRALKENSKSDVTLYNYGIILKSLGRPAEAVEQFSRALAINPAVPETWNNRGIVFNDLKLFEEANADFDKALSINANYPDALANKANALARLKLYDQALGAYDKALTLDPALVQAWIGRGNVHYNLKQYNDALAAYDKARSIKSDVAEAWLGCGGVYAELKRYDEALAAYDRAVALKSDLDEAWLGLGNIFYNLKRYNEAALAYDKAVTLRPDFAEAWTGRGNVFYDLKRYDDAAAAYDKALALKPDVAEAWAGRGNISASLEQHDDAVRAYDRALAINPDLKYVEGDRIQSKLFACDWTGLEADAAHLLQAVREGKSASVPFSILSIASSPADQLRCAELIVADKYVAMPPVWRGERYHHDRIRLAYLSGDFREHAMSYLASGMFACHDKSRFETTAISWGPDDKSDIRNRIIKSFDRFVDVRALEDAKAAELVRDMEIDIAVDLMGFTRGLRAGILARRPAPIQVNYLGYVGTMGAPYIDYIMADRTVIPSDQYAYFSEKVVCLPGSFQVNDRERRIADTVGARAEAGLPEEGFVFCCFNNNYKIAPDVFDIWMRILKRVDGSVFWLVGGGPTMERNLRDEAAARGVNAERLVFAKLVKLPEHLARLRLADLFLDTLPYNAGATASDSLWAGVPVLTRIGVAMNGRMAASLLNAIGLPELIAATPEAYEQTAVELATQPEKMAIIKRKLTENRLTTPLFDTKLFTKHIEAAYTAMHERHQAGLAPDHLYIPN